MNDIIIISSVITAIVVGIGAVAGISMQVVEKVTK